MSINTRESYIEIGTSVNADNTLNNVLQLPVPIELPSSNEFMADANRNANGVMMIQQIGRTQYKPSISVISSDRTPTKVDDYASKFEYAVSISSLTRTDNQYNQFPVRHLNKDNFLMLDGHVKTEYHKKMNMAGFKRVTQK